MRRFAHRWAQTLAGDNDPQGADPGGLGWNPPLWDAGMQFGEDPVSEAKAPLIPLADTAIWGLSGHIRPNEQDNC